MIEVNGNMTVTADRVEIDLDRIANIEEREFVWPRTERILEIETASGSVVRFHGVDERVRLSLEAAWRAQEEETTE